HPDRLADDRSVLPRSAEAPGVERSDARGRRRRDCPHRRRRLRRRRQPRARRAHRDLAGRSGRSLRASRRPRSGAERPALPRLRPRLHGRGRTVLVSHRRPRCGRTPRRRAPGAARQRQRLRARAAAPARHAHLLFGSRGGEPSRSGALGDRRRSRAPHAGRGADRAAGRLHVVPFRHRAARPERDGVLRDLMELFGALYGTAAMREAFGARRRVAAMLRFESALARAEARAGVIPEDAAAAIEAAAADPERIDLAAIAASADTVGYPVVALTKQLARLAGDDAGRYVHWGATIEALAALAKLHRDDTMPGRTHLQHALPITFGYACAVWLAPLLEHRRRLRDVFARSRVLQFGGAVGTLASLGARGREVALALACELDLHAADAPWHVDRSAFAEVACALGIACGSLAKIATDVILLMQTEVAEAAEPHAPGRGGSSTMPQKRNPIASEYVIAATRGVHALVPLMLQAMPGDHQRSTGPWQSEEIALPQICVLASAAFAHARTIVEGLSVDAARMRANLDETHGLIVAEAVSMALAERVGHARAHAIVESASSEAIAARRPLLDVLAVRPDVAAHVDRAQLAELLDPARYVGEAGAVVDRVLASIAAEPNGL